MQKLLAALPAQLNAVVLVCLHRPVERESELAKILARKTRLPIFIPRQGEILRPGACYLGRPRAHLTVDPGLVAHFVNDGFYRVHNIDLLFSSLARSAGPSAIGVLLSGLLSDGVEGLRAIKSTGGRALVQSPSSAEFDELPRNALAHDGQIDKVADVEELSAEIVRLVGGTAALTSVDYDESQRATS